MPRIADGFIFYKEVDVLKQRLTELDDVVDFFVLVESTHTFVGNPKPLIYDEISKIDPFFRRYKDKILHIVVDDFPHKAPNADISQGHQWQNEWFQRTAIHRGFDRLIREEKIGMGDYLIISDVDEIPNPRKLEELRHGRKEITIVSLVMDLYYYSMKFKLKQKWDRVKVIRVWKYVEILEKIPFNLDFIRNGTGGIDLPTERMEDGGKHLSYFGDKEFIKNKIRNFSHQEVNLPQFQEDAYLDHVMKEGLNLFGLQMELDVE
jgi:beta-1,4-mannosyl-glycoprotein beta-1,4-N-acetylglucosaminyltransferase